jgi:hypothetical protein
VWLKAKALSSSSSTAKKKKKKSLSSKIFSFRYSTLWLQLPHLDDSDPPLQLFLDLRVKDSQSQA